MIRPARDMSFVPTLTPAAAAKVRIIGSKDALASSGASSTIVYKISGLTDLAMSLVPFQNRGVPSTLRLI